MSPYARHLAAGRDLNPGDLVIAAEWYGGIPRMLVGVRGRILSMRYGVGPNRNKLYAVVQFESETRTRRVSAGSLKLAAVRP